MQTQIRNYQHWILQIHTDQSYLGRCVIWCRRENVNDLADASLEEQIELFVILKDIRSALIKAFEAEWFNYTFLGNETRHLHCHVIPRYSSPRQFEGLIFTDEQWGHNPYKGIKKDFVTTPELLKYIKDKLIENLR